ncbi:S-adenosyl-L-methionine dependent methyltransferase [Polyporus arcularius HHB13444]|uniref:S-adenosyl-L-methionine dependent methyltransferase n=1 Tax=Polyporus arcularius HHB13444 TaxID=1314778 RepID=A0A5C3PTY8_9APHY|nr:S-adenosyl-L-methionine dependent methyltransferase [Polyporus arcularius HHB13444]
MSNSGSSASKPQMEASASIYTKFGLSIYDLWVLTISNIFAWRCRTGAVLLPFYQQHLGESAHLEIGVGTGYYPAASVPALAKTKLITLLDLNPTTLVHAQQRLARAGYKGQIELLEHNVFQPLPARLSGKFDSVALFYVFHCLPGALPKKATDVFANIAPVLAPGAVVYGATILGAGVSHNWFGTRLMGIYNKKGIFGNVADSAEGLREALRESYEEWDVRIVGVVALFEARKPKGVGAKL